MNFVRFCAEGRDFRGVLKGGQVMDLAEAVRLSGIRDQQASDLLNSPLEEMVMQSGWMERVGEALAIHRPALTYPIDAVRLLPPVDRPGKVIAVGLNYPPAAPGEAYSPPPYPVLFHKAATSLVGSGSHIILPKISNEVEYEGELAVVIGRKARRVSAAEAMKYVAGMTIANDIGARDVQQRSSQWTSGKMFDTFCPLGPALVTPEDVGDPSGLRITTQLNDETVQDAPCSAMIFDVPTLISYISELTTLMPGDLILTGSPKTVGDSPAPSRLLQHGDIVRITIEPLGVLANPVEKET